MVESVNGFLVVGGCACCSTTHAAEEGGSLHDQVMAEILVGGQLDNECARRWPARTRSQRHQARRYAHLVVRGYRLARGEIHPPGLSRDRQEEEDGHLRHDAKEHDHQPENSLPGGVEALNVQKDLQCWSESAQEHGLGPSSASEDEDEEELEELPLTVK